MAKLTLDDLRKLRDTKQQAMKMRNPEDKQAQIIVGMGTCGIAAGAKETFNAIIEELNDQNITNVLVRQTGCMGLCHSEPTVEVVAENMPSVIYGNVDADLGRQIITKHIINKKMIDNHICDKPAMDIIQ
ncbi:MAG: (2Fe-2S) ferredoxin domain-containing protein [Kiritimatiellae bacterium]|jgi:NADP-reducing hydrogenase subunit HndB|nr:(2Fe-2S) ferredoxin domain-containing protein [Kiritimatiellia bacterium]